MSVYYYIIIIKCQLQSVTQLIPFGGLETTYDVHLGLMEKGVGDFVLLLIELFFTRCYG